MTFSYSGDPSSSTLDEIRFLTQDTTSPGLLANEEITYYVTKLTDVFSDPLMTAAFCAEVIAAKYAGEVSINADGVSYSGDQLAQKYSTLASSLRNRYCMLQGQGAEPFAGGSDIFTLEAIAGTVPLNFGIGQLDNMRAGDQRYGYLGDITLPYYEPDLDPSNYQP